MERRRKKKDLAEEEGQGEPEGLEQVSVAPREAAQSDAQTKSGGDKQVNPGEMFKVQRFGADAKRIERRASGRRSRSRTKRKSGRQISSRATSERITDLAFDATLRAAAPYQRERRERSDKATGDPAGTSGLPAESTSAPHAQRDLLCSRRKLEYGGGTTHAGDEKRRHEFAPRCLSAS